MTGSQSRRATQAEATRQRILRTARQLFDEHGYRATTTRRIAEAADVSEGLVFRYFPAKIDLLRRQPERPESLAHIVGSIVADRQDDPVRDVLDAVVRAVTTAAWSEVRQVQVLIGESATDPDVAEAFAGIMGTTAGDLSRDLGRRVAAGELRADLHCDAAASQLVGSLLLFALTHAHLPPDRRQAAAAEHGTALVDSWMLAATAAAPDP